MNPLSSIGTEAVNSQESGVVFITLLTITHPLLPSPLYLSSDPTTRILDANGQPYYITMSRGNAYVFLPFQPTRPDDRGDQVATGSISIDNIGIPSGTPGVYLKISDAIRAIGITPASVLMEFVTNETPDVLEGDSFQLVARDVTYDAMTVSARLGFEEILDEPWPPRQVTPNTLPGVFAIAS